MRAFHNLQALSSHYSVNLLVVQTSFDRAVWNGEVRALCVKAVCVPLSPMRDWRQTLKASAEKLSPRVLGRLLSEPADWATTRSRSLHRAVEMLCGEAYDLVHVFRFYLTPVADLLRSKGLSCHHELDLDDIESETRRRIAELCAVNGERRWAARMSLQAEKYARLEEQHLRQCDRIFVCSRQDQDKLRIRFGSMPVEILPNIATIPVSPARAHGTGPFRFLFVGALAYYPNIDALLYFAREVLPLVRTMAPTPWRLRVVGADLPRAAASVLLRHPEIELAGHVPALAQEYERADAVVVPIRGGGGTRMKVLEAFAHRVPVVSTAAGIEGIEAANGEHALIADTPQAFADACLKVMTHGSLAAELAERACALVGTSYSLEAARKVLCPHAN